MRCPLSTSSKLKLRKCPCQVWKDQKHTVRVVGYKGIFRDRWPDGREDTMMTSNPRSLGGLTAGDRGNDRDSSNFLHYSDVTMSTMASQITSLTIVYLTVCSGADQRQHPSSALLAFVRGIHMWPVSEIPAQMASNAENVSILWSHHGLTAGDRGNDQDNSDFLLYKC